MGDRPCLQSLLHGFPALTGRDSSPSNAVPWLRTLWCHARALGLRIVQGLKGLGVGCGRSFTAWQDQAGGPPTPRGRVPLGMNNELSDGGKHPRLHRPAASAHANSPQPWASAPTVPLPLIPDPTALPSPLLHCWDACPQSIYNKLCQIARCQSLTWQTWATRFTHEQCQTQTQVCAGGSAPIGPHLCPPTETGTLLVPSFGAPGPCAKGEGRVA